MRKFFVIAICAALAALWYFKGAAKIGKKDPVGFLPQAIGVQRALDAKQAAVEMKKKVEEAEARRQADIDAASDENGAAASRPHAPEMEPAKPSD